MKRAYPNFAPDSVFTKPSYNLNKWLEAMREIYSQVHYGNLFKDAFGSVTSGWDKVEKRDFSNWLSYYQSGDQSKYKKANFYVNDNIPGYFLPNPKPVVPPAIPNLSEPTSLVENTLPTQVSQEQKRKLMEEQRKKIIGRLNAAIKHLTSYEGHLLAGGEFDKLLTSMYELLRQIQTVNKISLSNQLYYDLITRQVNKLNNNGFNKSAQFLIKLAQMPGVPLEPGVPGKLDFPQGEIPIASQQSDGVAGSLPNNIPPAAVVPASDKSEEKDPLDELLDNLDTAGLTDSNLTEDESEDEKEEEEEIEFILPEDVDDLEIILDEDDLFVEAQIQPPHLTNEQKLEAELPEVPELEHSEPAKNIDAIIDNALSNITIKDVVKKIENVNAIFQNRTIARELSIIDLMLSTLGLSSYFNNLSEIIQKNHEASNYSISRLSDILMKLRGAMTDDTLPEQEHENLNPEIQKVQENLERAKEKENSRKEMRKQLQEEALDEEMNDKTSKPELPTTIPPPATQSPKEEIAQAPTQIIQ